MFPTMLEDQISLPSSVARAEHQVQPEPAHQPPTRVNSVRNRNGFVKLFGASAVLMSVLLPIGIAPRLLQSNELDRRETNLKQALPAVSVARVAANVNEKRLSLPGTTEAIFETPIYARSNGYVKERLVDIGDKVAAHQLLAVVETPEIDDSAQEARATVLTSVAAKAQAIAQRDQAAADLQNLTANAAQARATLIQRQSEEHFASTTYKRFLKLGREGAVSAQDVDERETNLKATTAVRQAAEEQVKSADAALAAAKSKFEAQGANVDVTIANINAAKAREKRSQSEQSFQQVLSPFAGVITKRNIEQGMLITSGSDSAKQPLYELASIDQLKVFVDVPQFAAPEIKIGMPVEVTLSEFPSRIFRGTVARTSVALDPSARTLRTEVHIDNKDLALAPGMYADVALVIAPPKGTVLVPANSVITRGNGPQVVVLDMKNREVAGTVRYRSVKLGDDSGQQIEVLGGLKTGEQVVVNPMDSLKNGTAVAIAKTE